MTITVSARAKINLTLEVLGRRGDGFHEIVSVMQCIDLSDTLTVAPAPALHLHAPGMDCDAEDNLALKAARLLQAHTGCARGASIRLRKRIPLAAGLGGGSSDAAAVLLALNDLWSLGLEADELHSLASSLGSDVPFFLSGGTALAEGRGERLTVLPDISGYWAVLAVPPVAIVHKTRALYAALLPGDFSDGAATRELAAALSSGHGLAGSLLVNAFERAAFSMYPPVAACHRAILEAGAAFAHLSGSGPTVYTVTTSEDAARQLCARLRRRHIVCRLAAFHGCSAQLALPEPKPNPQFN
jgi:4-diphosphocytidyl-2-C-methyl-D-erythritol kinase